MNPQQTEVVLDQTALDDLRACDPDDSGLLAELIDIFLADTPPRLNAIRRAADAAQPQALANEAHALKSSAAQLGALALSAICRKLEALGREGSLLGVDELVARLEPEFAAAREALLVARRG